MSLSLRKTLVIQPSPGIGDMIWHLPYLRAIARTAPDGKITLLTKSRSQAHRWLAADPIINEVIAVDRDFSLYTCPLRLWSRRFERVWVLHRSYSYALVAKLSGIRERFGFGYGKQKKLLTTDIILEPSLKTATTIKQVKTLVERHGLEINPLDQALRLCPQAVAAVKSRFRDIKRPWVCFGIGGSEAFKKWPLESFSSLALALSKNYANFTFMITGGPQDQASAFRLTQDLKSQGLQALSVCDLPIEQTCAFVASCDLYIGNDTSLLNIAAVAGVKAIGLFGATPPLDYSANIIPVMHPEGKICQELGMRSLTPEQVLAVVKSNFPEGGPPTQERYNAPHNR